MKRGKKSINCVTADLFIERLRAKLVSKGARVIIVLGRAFRIMDVTHSTYLDKYEFTKAMQEFALGFKALEISCIFCAFDLNGDQYVDYLSS